MQEFRAELYRLGDDLYSDTKFNASSIKISPPIQPIPPTCSVSSIPHSFHGSYPAQSQNVTIFNNPAYYPPPSFVVIKSSKDKEEKKSNGVLGVITIAGASLFGAYLFASLYIIRSRVRQLGKQAKDFKGTYPYVVSSWKQWTNMYTSTNNHFDLSKVGLLVSVVTFGIGEYFGVPCISKGAAWSMLIPSCYLVFLYTMYYGKWRDEERKLFHKIVEEVNASIATKEASAPS
jgi:hypothetical protein